MNLGKWMWVNDVSQRALARMIGTSLAKVSSVMDEKLPRRAYFSADVARRVVAATRGAVTFREAMLHDAAEGRKWLRRRGDKRKDGKKRILYVWFTEEEIVAVSRRAGEAGVNVPRYVRRAVRGHMPSPDFSLGAHPPARPGRRASRPA